MNGKFICVLAIFAIVAALTFGEADACKHCGVNLCGGCQPSYRTSHLIPAPMPVPMPAPVPVPVPVPSYSPCYGCGERTVTYGHLPHASPLPLPSPLPRPYCSGCLARKTIRLNSNCDCGCSC